ncbi:hypothetical protein CYMTET_47549 [Cymbomonas tetramitiformis]|uniref:PH domain-containing protein n=1 Tax=Cymbomonas tetramitiformis TaxID=36881 RepID=A0AAE0BVT1_9CHLO|nr:hypothetical protein CYMTET_47549 [Cymbomonas tetramitiformis]
MQNESFPRVDSATRLSESPPSSLLHIDKACVELDSPKEVVIGILNKWVNGVKGYHHRYFILDTTTGVLSYFKVHGSSKINVAVDLEQPGVTTIGETVLKFKRKHKRDIDSKKSWSVARPEAQGEVHLRVSTLRESGADHKKFYIHSGTKTLQLRAETREDRWVWLEVLEKAKAMSFVSTPSRPESSRPTFVKDLCSEVSSTLEEKGVPTEVSQFVMEKMLQLYSGSVQQLKTEREKRRMLLDYIRSLEDDKRLLESEVVVEQYRHNLPQADGAESTLVKSESVSQLFEKLESASEEEDEADEEDDVADEGFDEPIFFDAPDEAIKPSPRAGFDAPAMDEAENVGAAVVRRHVLPVPVEKENSMNLWSIIKEMVGKDLTKVCLPVYFNEPLSSLQKVAEELEYSHLLDLAAAAPKGSVDRLKYIAAYAVSGYSSTQGRTQKPFNPLELETYEFVCPERGFRFLAEKVCHHPTILACHCEGKGWTMAGDCNLKSKFKGSYIEVTPVGTCQVKFDDGEVVSWKKVNSTINNLILGKLYVDHFGTMKVASSMGSNVKLKFKSLGFMDRNPHQVKGEVVDHTGTVVGQLTGNWDKAMSFRQASTPPTPCSMPPATLPPQQ